MSDRFDDQINDFWNEIVTSGDANAGALDSRLADAVEQVHALSQSPISDSARERIRRKVLDQSVSTEGAELVNLTAAALPLPNRNGHTAPIRRSPARTAPAALPRSRMRWALLAAALVLILGGIGSYFFESPGNRLFGGGNNPQPNVIPAATVESGWPQFRGGASRTGYSSDPGPGGDLDLRWTFTADEVMNDVVSQGSSVYAYGRKGDLFALNASTGAQRWAVDLSPNEYTTENRYPIPAVADGMIYAGTFEGALVALSTETGEIVWQRSLSTQPLIASPAVAGGVLYVATPEGAILAIDPGTGETTWEWTGDAAIDTGQPAVGGDHLYISNVDGDLVAIDTASGQTGWIADLNQAHRVTAYRDGVVYTAGLNNRYYALDAATGAVNWMSEPLSGEQTLNPVVTPKLLIATSQAGVLQALDLATGEVVWSGDGPGDSSSPHASSTAVYVKSPDQTAFIAYDLETGAELGRAPLSDVGSTAAISGDTLVLSGNGDPAVVRSFGPGAGAPNAVVAFPSAPLTVATPAPVAEATVVASTFDPAQVQLIQEFSGSVDHPIKIVGWPSIGPDGNIYVPSLETSTIEIFAKDGAYIESWGDPGSGPGQFGGPQALDFDADGNIYVFDTGNVRIQKFAPDRTFLLEWGTKGTGDGQFEEVDAGVVDSEAGLIYVPDFVNNRVQVFDLDGNFVEKWGSAGNQPGQFVHPTVITLDADGNLWVGEQANGSGARVQKFDPHGNYLGAVGADSGLDGTPYHFTEVWGLAFDAQGNLFVSDYWTNTVVVFDADFDKIGEILDVPGAGPFNVPIGLTFDDEGYLYVADGMNNRVLKLEIPPIG
jgi:outer membrane protein assembly factor BamB